MVDINKKWNAKQLVDMATHTIENLDPQSPDMHPSNMSMLIQKDLLNEYSHFNEE